MKFRNFKYMMHLIRTLLYRKRIFWTGIMIVVIPALAVIGIQYFRRGQESMLNTLPDRNLIIICIDALRADHLSCYGYGRPTSPRIDELADHGILFENAFSNSSFTKESVSAIFSGRLPSRSGSYGWKAKPHHKSTGLAQLFTMAGFRTAFMTTAPTLKPKSFSMGFDEIRFCLLSDIPGDNISRLGPMLSDSAIGFITRYKDRRFMMYLHYIDPHGPYDPPDSVHRQFARQPYPHPLEIHNEVCMNLNKLIKNGFGPGDPCFEDVIVRYDAEIAHTDYSIGMLVDALKKLNILDQTMIIITADHGEEFLDHGFVEHAWTLYRESTRIPLIISSSRITAPQQIEDRVSSVDILPTLLTLFQIPDQAIPFDGEALFQHRNGSLGFVPPSRPYIAELMVQHRNMLRTVVKDQWKYMAAVKWVIPENRPQALTVNIHQLENDTSLHLDPWGPIVHEELYHLADDPLEKHNRITECPEKRDELKIILEQYRLLCRKKSTIPTSIPSQKDSLTPDEVKALKTLGYF